MTATVMDRIWEILGEVFALNAEAFQTITTVSGGFTLALLVVVCAGLSLAVGQSIILFLNRVQPIRFFFSILISAILYLFEFLFLVFSTWFICLLPNSVHLTLSTLTIILGVSYAPLLFSFLGALPYFGLPLLRLFSIWHLLAMAIGFSAVANVSVGSAFGYVAIGWLVKETLEHTIGQPIARLGKAIADRTAGVDLAQHRDDLKDLVQSRFSPSPSPLITAQTTEHTGRSQPAPNDPFFQALRRDRPASTLDATPPNPTSLASAIATPPADHADPLARLAFQTSSIPKPVKVVLGLVTLVLLFVLVFLLLRPVRDGIFGWYQTLPRLGRLIFDLSWIGVVGVIFAGLLAPFETLGWWAGWFGDNLETTTSLPAQSTSMATAPPVTRYVVYLDGVGQSGEAHTPDVEDFLAALKPQLPPDVQLIHGLMMYSVLNKPLNEDRPLTFLWKLADNMRWQNPTAILGMLVNVRNALIVMVSADQRYGPIYNRGIAQVLYNGLITHGYHPGSGIPITLLGYSGGAQMSVAAAPYLKQTLGAPIDTISIGGVMSANNNLLMLEHLYHLVGDQDEVEKLGPILFSGRWKILPLSYWNRAKRKGKISILSVGAVGHQVPGGYMDPNALLANGVSHLQHTIALIVQILTGTLPPTSTPIPAQVSNYAQYKQADFNDPAYYPLDQSVDPTWYRAIAPWMGRLILPPKDQRAIVRGILFEVHHTAPGYEHLIGQVVILRWADSPTLKTLVQAARRDVYFSAEAEYSSRYGGLIHPDRINQWQQVGPLESLAASHPSDDLVVMLPDPVMVETTTIDLRGDFGAIAPAILRIQSQPVQITGRYYALVKFIAPIANTDQFQVVHFNRATRQFDGLQAVIRLPDVVIADACGSAPSTPRDLEKSPFNETGWYVYGAKDANGQFVVQALGPRALFGLQPDEVIFGRKAAYRYIRQRSWANITAQKGRIASVLCTARDNGSSGAIQAAIAEWQEGDRALVLHVYGGIGGHKAEPAAATPIFFGHFAFGVAHVIRDPLSDDLRFDLRYYQVYTHNTDGLVAGTLHWSRYMGDRQFGWLGNRPTCDILIKHNAFIDPYDFPSGRQSALDYMLFQLEVMTARYRIGDGTGGTYVGAASNCAQDSNQALFASLRHIEQRVRANTEALQRWSEQAPDQAIRFQQLLTLQHQLRQQLQPLGGPKSAWERNEYNLGTTLEDAPLRNLVAGLGSWRTMLPRLASDTVVKVFLDHGASVWVLRTNQIGGYDPDIEPVAPMTL